MTTTRRVNGIERTFPRVVQGEELRKMVYTLVPFT